MDIGRNETAWIRETPRGRYLLVNSTTHDPAYFLVELFSESDGAWQPLVCAPINDQRVLAFDVIFAEGGDAVEIALPEDLPTPLGRVPGETWIQYSSQSVAAWGPGFTWWQRLQYRATGRSRYVEEARHAGGESSLST